MLNSPLKYFLHANMHKFIAQKVQRVLLHINEGGEQFLNLKKSKMKDISYFIDTKERLELKMPMKKRSEYFIKMRESSMDL